MTLQRSTYYYTFPRVRLYRDPRQIWVCWFGWSLHHANPDTPANATDVGSPVLTHEKGPGHE